MLRVITSLFFFVLACYLVLIMVAGDAIEENGGIKNTIIELGKDAKDVWGEISDHEPSNGPKSDE